MTQGEFNLAVNYRCILSAKIMRDLHILMHHKGVMLYDIEIARDIAMRLRAHWKIRIAAAVKTFDEIVRISKEYDCQDTGFTVVYEPIQRGHLLIVIYDYPGSDPFDDIEESDELEAVDMVENLPSMQYMDIDTFINRIQQMLPNIDWDLDMTTRAYSGYLYTLIYYRQDYQVIDDRLLYTLTRIDDIQKRYHIEKGTLITPILMKGSASNHICCSLLLGTADNIQRRVYWYDK